MQASALIGEHDRRRPPRDPVLARVDAVAERLAGGLELGEVRVSAAQVVLGRDQIGPGDPDRRLRAALGLRGGRHAGRDRQPVVAADRDDLRVGDRHPADVVDRDRPLVVGQRIGRRAAKRPQRPIKRHHHRRHRPIPQREHDAKPRPGQPRAEQHGRPAGDRRPVAVVPLHPQPRLDRPRPEPATVLGPPRPLRRRDRPPRRALRAQIAHRKQPLMRDVRANPPARPIDPLLDLHRERVHPRPWPHRHRQPATGLIACRNPVRDRLVITPHQLRSATQRAGQIERFQDLHHFLRVLQARPQARLDNTRRPGLQADQDETVGKSDGHPWGDPVTASGDSRWPPTGRIPWPPSLARPPVSMEAAPFETNAALWRRLGARTRTRPVRGRPTPPPQARCFLCS